MTKTLASSIALASIAGAFAANTAKDATKGGPSKQDATALADAAAQEGTTADPFAELPRISVEDYSITDLSTVETANPRKYSGAVEAALKAKSQIKPGWKHATAMLKVGPHEPEGMKPTSVMGMIRNKVASYGRAGVPAYVIVDYLRREARDNKRSHYANGKVPPIGWAEDYINGALSKKLVAVIEGKVAPALPAELEQAAADAATAAQKEQKAA